MVTFQKRFSKEGLKDVIEKCKYVIKNLLNSTKLTTITVLKSVSTKLEIV